MSTIKLHILYKKKLDPLHIVLYGADGNVCVTTCGGCPMHSGYPAYTVYQVDGSPLTNATGNIWG